MIKFDKNKIMQEKTAVRCKTIDEAVKLMKWAESVGICRKGGYEANGWKNGWRSTRAYDLYKGRCLDIDDFCKNGYNIYEYEDVIKELRDKETDDKVICMHDDKLKTGTIFSVCGYGKRYTIEDEDSHLFVIDKKLVWFDSINLELRLTKNGIKVTGEVEPENEYFCPICRGKLNICNGNVDKFKAFNVHECSHNIVVNVVGSTVEEVHQNLCKFYKEIKNEEGSN